MFQLAMTVCLDQLDKPTPLHSTALEDGVLGQNAQLSPNVDVRVT